MLIMNNGKPLYRIFHQIAQYEEFSRNVLIFDPVSGAVINEDSTFNCTLPSMSRDINLYKLNELIIPYDHDAPDISGFNLEPQIDFRQIWKANSKKKFTQEINRQLMDLFVQYHTDWDMIVKHVEPLIGPARCKNRIFQLLTVNHQNQQRPFRLQQERVYIS